MRLFVLLTLVALALAKPNKQNRMMRVDDVDANPDIDIKEFEEDFHQMINDPDKEKEFADELQKEEAEIQKKNQEFKDGKSTFDEKVYPWSDLTSEEMQNMEGLNDDSGVIRSFGLLEEPEHMRENSPETQAILDEIYASIDRESLPATYNSQDSGLITPARNQKSCGSCAAFAATAIHETCLRKAGTPMDGLDLAEQQLVDCAYDGNGANGCNGAWLHIYSDFMANRANGVINHEAHYPYLDRQPNLSCQNKQNWNAGAKIKSYTYDRSCDEDKLKQLVYQFGAVVTGVYASGNGFGNYRTGVLKDDNPEGKNLNHAVTVVGWGEENGCPYWLVKNSWGDNWGNKGFIKMFRGNHECHIGTKCAVVTCESTGTADTAPEVPAPPPIPASQQCDVSPLYGPNLTGNYNLWTYNEKGEFISEVKCTKSICSPRVAGPSNACTYVCGKVKC